MQLLYDTSFPDVIQLVKEWKIEILEYDFETTVKANEIYTAIHRGVKEFREQIKGKLKPPRYLKVEVELVE